VPSATVTVAPELAPVLVPVLGVEVRVVDDELPQAASAAAAASATRPPPAIFPGLYTLTPPARDHSAGRPAAGRSDKCSSPAVRPVLSSDDSAYCSRQLLQSFPYTGCNSAAAKSELEVGDRRHVLGAGDDLLAGRTPICFSTLA
jgi:hypothetical protein